MLAFTWIRRGSNKVRKHCKIIDLLKVMKEKMGVWAGPTSRVKASKGPQKSKRLVS